MARIESVIALAFFAFSFGRSSAASTSSSGTTSTTPIADSGKTKEIEMSSSQDGMASSEETTANDLPDLVAIMNECNDSFRIENGFLESLNESGSFPDETDRTPKCYIRCFLELSKVFLEDGTFDPARTAMVFSDGQTGKVLSDLEDMATMCGEGRNEKCKCERSYKFIKCLMETKIEKYETQ